MDVIEDQPERRITRSMTGSDLPVNNNLVENMGVINSISWDDEALPPNINKIIEFAMVGGKDGSYVNLKDFEEEWNYKNE